MAGCYVGLNDLSISLGLAPEAVTGAGLAPELEDLLGHVLEACRSTGKVAGVQLYDPAAVNRRLAQGFRFVGLGTELRVLQQAAGVMLEAIRR